MAAFKEEQKEAICTGDTDPIHMFMRVTKGLISSFSFILIFNLKLKKFVGGDGQVTPSVSVKSSDMVFSADYQVRARAGSAAVIHMRC